MMDREQALDKLQAAFPGAECAVTGEPGMVWFGVKSERSLPRIAFPTFDHVDAAIRTLRQ